MHERATLLDLFSGIGGFSLAANRAGFKTVGFAEIDPFCSEILKKHWPDVPNHGDITQLNYPSHINLITGGFPCQPFSVAGKRKGKDDTRYLWQEFYRIIKQARPCWIVAENVTGLVSLGLDHILSDLEAENYATTTLVLPACAANAPHRRDRLWIIAHRSSERCNHCSYHRQRGHIQAHEERYLPAIQQKWAQLKPLAWETYKANDWLQYNTRVSGANDGIPNRVDRVKAIGNSIVPQVAFAILSLIYSLEID